VGWVNGAHELQRTIVKSLSIVAPFARGGATDLVARIYAAALEEELGITVAIENEPGAGGTRGALRVARARPDGKTLVMGTSSTHGISNALFREMPYEWAADFTPIAPLVLAPNVLLVPAQGEVGSVAELEAKARARPATLTFGSAGFGQTIHLCGELFRALAGVDIVHAPRAGSAVALEELARGELDLMFDNILSALPYVRAGRLRALAVTSGARSRELPHTPTMMEAGVAHYDLTVWIGILGPAGLPHALQRRFERATHAIIETPAIRSRLESMGAEPLTASAARFAELIASEAQKWAHAVARSGVRADRP
jgi:tripartite-type tricarboxylate transporter receptor subunit TctC